MNYRFGLEALKQYRTYQEEERQKKMAEAQRLRDQEAAKLEALQTLRIETEKSLKAIQQSAVTAPQLTIYNHYLDKIASDIFAQKHKVAQAEIGVEKSREALLAAMQERKALEKLKEKGLRSHLAHLSHEENKFINEMAISRYAMKQK